MIHKKKLTIIIVTFESSQIIKNCLEGLNAKKHNVVVVDNNSQDDTVKIIQERFPEVKIIKSDKNLGYGRANNIALKQAETEFSLILNPDAMILEGDIEKVLNVMSQDENISIGAPILLKNYPTNQSELETKLKKANQNFLLRKKGFISKDENGFVCDFLSGAVLFLRMSIFRKIGFFDPELFLFYEDNDICQKSIANNYKNILVNSALAFHLAGKSSQVNKKTDNNYKIGWHLKGWSKFYFMQKTKGLIMSKILSFFAIIQYTGKIIFLALTLNLKRARLYAGGIVGSLYFLIGAKAFDKNNNPRG